MLQLLDLPADVLCEMTWDSKDLLSVVRTCRSFNAMFTPKIYEIVTFNGGSEGQTVSRSVLAFVETIATRPDLGKLVRRLFMSSWYHHLDSSSTFTPKLVVERLGCRMLSRLTELRELHIDYPAGVDLLKDCSFHKLVKVSICAEGHARREQSTEHFEHAARLLSLPHLRTFTISCALIDDPEILKMLPPDSSNVQNITIACRNISKTSLQLLLAITKSLKTFRWCNRTWDCHTVRGEAACATISSAEIAQCLHEVKDSLEELAIEHAYIKICPHDTGVLGSLHEFPNLKTMTLTPQMLLGWQVCQVVTDTLESNYLANLGRISGLPQDLVKIRLQAWTEGKILEYFIESLVGDSDLRLLDVIELESISEFDKICASTRGAIYPIHPLSFKTYMRLYKQCRAKRITLQNCEFDYQRARITAAGALESPDLWDDEKWQHQNPVLELSSGVTWTVYESGSDESYEPWLTRFGTGPEWHGRNPT